MAGKLQSSSRSVRIDIEVRDKGSFKVLRAKENIDSTTDLSELRDIVFDQIEKGARNFAFAFTGDSYMYTRSIAVLISCIERIKEHKGRIAVIEANQNIMGVLGVLNLIDRNSVVAVYDSEEDLLQAN